MDQPGLIALMGSGETSTAGGQVFEAVASRLGPPLKIRILETPAGFELNANRVAGRVAEFLNMRLQNYQPDVRLIPARRRGTPNSPDSPAAIKGLLDGRMVFMGPGSPSYAVRQLAGSLAWDYLNILHRTGASLVLASAATISLGRLALPVYEIYKVGEDPHWKPGLNFFEPFGLDLILLPHWNNNEGGNELDTSRCFVGVERFNILIHQIPASTTVLGLDEHTGLLIDLAAGECTVMGRSQVHILRGGKERTFENGDNFKISQLGNFHTLADPQTGIDPEVWKQFFEDRQSIEPQSSEGMNAPQEVIELVEQRQLARERKQWHESDELREQIAAMGWKVTDTPLGPRLERT